MGTPFSIWPGPKKVLVSSDNPKLTWTRPELNRIPFATYVTYTGFAVMRSERDDQLHHMPIVNCVWW